MRLRFIPLILFALGTTAHGGESAPPVPSLPRRVVRLPRPPQLPALHGHRFLIVGDGRVSDTLLAVPAGSRLDLENFGGSIAISGWDRNAVRVRATHESNTRVGVEVGPGSVVVRAETEIEVPDFGRSRPRRVTRVSIPAEVDYQLMVPRLMGLRLSGVSSEITVTEVGGDVSAEAIEGTVTLCGSRGTIRASSVNGGVEVIGAHGSVEATSVSGDILVVGTQGPIRVESVSGDVALAEVSSRSVEVSTTDGDMQFAGVITADGSYRFSTHSGDMVVVLPEHPDVAVNVNAYTGGFQSSFPIPVKEIRRGRQFRFTLGDGRSELDLESFSGDVRLMRQGEGGRAAILFRRDIQDRMKEAEARARALGVEAHALGVAKEALERARESTKAKGGR